MPTSHEILQNGQWLRIRGFGILTGEEMVSAIASLEAVPELFRQLKFCTTELEEVTELRLGPDHIRALIDIDLRLATVNPTLCIAVIAPKIEVFGMARMWQALVDPVGWPTGVFREPEEARVWLDSALRSVGV